MSAELRLWMNAVSGKGWRWYVKRLSGNDTLLTAAHQAGPYVPKPVAFQLFPSIHDEAQKNPRADFEAIIDSHSVAATPRVIWYNNKVTDPKGTRNECRLTNWGGKSSPILDPEATGSICILAFQQATGKDAALCRIWLCSSVEEEDAAEDRVGVVEPGLGFLYDASGEAPHPFEKPVDAPCHLKPEEVPEGWRLSFPEAAAIVDFAVKRLQRTLKQPPDQRLIRRRKCEYEVFRSLEQIVVMPRILEGFATVDLFVDFANSVTNRRKARAGASLELHTRAILSEESVPFSYNKVSEFGKKPDFLFPSAEAYHDLTFPDSKLQMLAAKTTCKDRWRQILDEAERIPVKHLLTMQDGVSLTQFAQMQSAGVQLVVPQSLHEHFHKDIRPHLLTLDAFIKDTKAKYS